MNHIKGNIVPISQLCATFLIELIALSLNTGGAQSATFLINSFFNFNNQINSQKNSNKHTDC
jgi:hypothetical protein